MPPHSKRAIHSTGMSPRSWSLLKILVLLFFLAAAVVLYRFTALGDYIAIPRLRAFIASLQPLTARLAYVALYVVGTVLLLPGVLMSFVGAVLFGAYEGTLYTWIGAAIGATLAFFLAKSLGRDFVERFLGGRLAALDRRLEQHGFTGLLVLRLVPLFPFNALNFGCGLTRIRARDYILATAVGILPGTFVYQFLFARFGQKILDEGFAWSDLWDPVLGLALALFVLFIVAGKIVANRLAAPRPSLGDDPEEGRDRRS
jgi:uncharacterized membrane protein YdjX (TVP38/TMEM64 family)